MTEFSPQYPTIEVTPDSWATIWNNWVNCVCGDTDYGFSDADRQGMLAMIIIGPDVDGLADFPDDGGFIVCNNCGRVYDDRHVRGGEDKTQVLFQYDVESAEWNEARALYTLINFGD